MDRRPFRLRPAALTVVLVFFLLAAAPNRPSDPIDPGLADLHQGLYERAATAFRAAGRAAAADPEPALFVAFAYWWRLLDDRSDTSLDAPFHAAAGEAVALGERRLEANPTEARALAALGTAHILRFHVEAIRRNYRSAAHEARRGKKLLEEALERQPGLADPLFALGAYNYYASQIPPLARGLAVFLRLPGGDRALGLEQLRRVASSDSRFRTSGRLLLASICGAREERCYTQAFGHLDRALADSPGSPLILGSRGDLHLRLGDHDAAARSFEEALAAAAGPDPERARQRRALRLLLLEALVAGWRLEDAKTPLAALRTEGGVLTERERRSLRRLEEELAFKRRLPEAEAARSADREGRRVEALDILGRAAAARPDDPLPRFLTGHLLLLYGRPREAEPELVAAAGLAVDPPGWLEGWLEIDLGLARRAAGRSRAARGHFRRAAEVRRFRSADLALLELARDDGVPEGCDP
jgi:tetratricopeptide (TPR) repeat protein